MSGRSGLRIALGHALAVAAALLGCLALLAAVCGVRAVPVLTGSMSPGIPSGSLVLVTRLDPDRVRPGQTVVFRPPVSWPTAGGRPVLHRVADVDRSAATPSMHTKGDANPARDPWTVALDPGAELGLARGHVPHLGRVLAAGPAAAGLLLGGLALAVLGARRRRPACTCSTAGRGC